MNKQYLYVQPVNLHAIHGKRLNSNDYSQLKCLRQALFLQLFIIKIYIFFIFPYLVDLSKIFPQYVETNKYSDSQILFT